jgi:hypothetical protein
MTTADVSDNINEVDMPNFGQEIFHEGRKTC